MPKYKLREMPDMSNTGKRKVYPMLKTIARIDEEKLIERIAMRGGAFSKGTIKGVLTALSQSVADMLSYSYTVDVPGLGVFSLALDFDDEKPDVIQKEDDRMTHRHVKIRNINFRTDRELLKTVQLETELERESSGVSKLKSTQITPEMRLERTIQHIKENGSISLSDYTILNHVSRSTASRELRRFSAGEESKLRIVGKAPHRYWILR